MKKGKRQGISRKMAAIFLAAALFAQQCSVTAVAAESQTDVQTTETQATEAQTAATEAQTQATEAQTQATEAQTQATETQTQATEAQTQATETQTQATETQTAATEAQTQATEAQTQATEAQTQAAETQTAAEAESGGTEASAETEKATEAANAGASTESEKTTETETAESETADSETAAGSAAETETESETETETERSARKNAGEKLKRKELAKKLEKVLPYLIVAKDVTIPEKVTDELVAQVLEDQAAAVSEDASDNAAEEEETDSGSQAEDEILDALILDGDEGKALLSELAKVSTVLADAQTTDEVTVINLYADETGELDETQLTALFADKVPDITKAVYVINIVAEGADQELEFSGYSVKRSGKTVTYSDVSESGSVIYNFVAIEEDGIYTEYKGKLKLSGSVQGTILAPAATVESEGNLSGAVYASSVTVKNENAKLLPIVFLAEEIEEETQASAESETVSGTAGTSLEESESGAGNETSAEDEIETETEKETQNETGTESESEIISDSETETEKISEVETDSETETDSEAEIETYCVVKLSISLNVYDRDGSALATSEKFYMNIYSDEEMTTAVNESPIAFSMGGDAAKTKTCKLKLTKPQQTFYLRETDSSGTAVITGENGFAYLMSLDEENAVTVSCGDTSAAVSVWNKLNDSTIKIRVEDSSDGSLLSGATLAVKDSDGKIYEVETVGSKTFSSGTAEIVWTNALTDGETYYLTEITAPAGYTPVPDVAFTVVRGGTTEVVLKNEAAVTTGYALTVTQEVYAGDYQVYAYDTTTGTYQANGAYTYYVALFSDSARKNKVSNVVSLNVNGFSGNVTFLNLTPNGVYYVAATDEYGVVLSSTDEMTVRYTNSGMVQMSEAVRSMVVQNVYASLPEGYRYTGTLTLTMNVTDSSGTAEAVTKTFYAGIYRNADYSDTPTIVQMSLSNASTVSVRRRILLSGESDMTYYIAEVDANGNRITDSSDFSYVVTVDNPAVTITKGSNQTVTITNRVKATKATLYLTKRVYNGTTLKAVSETFYVGLFKDADMTELYADPIAMELDNASELTLKLTLNLGTTSGVTVYIAEVDEDGNVITNQREFGYQIKIVNATAAFTQDNLEIQTILLNSVYGSTSTDGWDSIFAATSSDYLDTDSYYTVDDNGSATGVAKTVETGDMTPLAAYAFLMGAAALAFGWGAQRKRRRFL
ncbi:MAG: hypothetical protein LUD18_09930 [Lachnospiraceae bacterium]|nr:hypothetical protein [Lachnospiraceae bacterium]